MSSLNDRAVEQMPSPSTQLELVLVNNHDMSVTLFVFQVEMCP